MDAVIAQIQEDVNNGDVTAIEELLGNVSKKDLVAFLSEEKQAEIG
jgi:hypothetical protein